VTDKVGGVTCILLGVALIALADCGAGRDAGAERGPRADRRADGIANTKKASDETAPAAGTEPTRVDPRRAGLDISLGEWAVTPEAKAIRPGRVTLVITNRGTMNHGFEIEADWDHSGSGGGEGLKLETELLAPGESTKVPIELAPGIYKIECFVEGHDDLGMENFLHVRADAPLVTQAATKSGGSKVSIENFSFAPKTIEVEAGGQITWVNNDPTEHTVTGDVPALRSDSLGTGETFSARIDEPGTYTYQCSIHPEMTARVEVSE
jgi:plastocyanin